jgi:hypothetical protein
MLHGQRSSRTLGLELAVLLVGYPKKIIVRNAGGLQACGITFRVSARRPFPDASPSFSS